MLIFALYRARNSARTIAEEKDLEITRLKEIVQRQAQAIERSLSELSRRSDDRVLKLEELIHQRALELDELGSKICDYKGKANIHERNTAIRAVTADLKELLVFDQGLLSALVRTAFKGEPLVFYFEMAEEKGLHKVADSDTAKLVELSELINRCHSLYEVMLSYLLDYLQLVQRRNAKEVNLTAWTTADEISLQSMLQKVEKNYAQYCSMLERVLAVGQ